MKRDAARTEDLITSAFRLVDAVVEIYLGHVVKPFVRAHERFYSALNSVLRKVLDDHSRDIPDWFTANFITYFRTALVVPTLLLLALEYYFFASVLVLAVDFGDFLDGVVARFWVDEMKNRAAGPTGPAAKAVTIATAKDRKPNISPANSDDESFGRWTQCRSSACTFRPVCLVVAVTELLHATSIQTVLCSHTCVFAVRRWNRGCDYWVTARGTIVGPQPTSTHIRQLFGRRV